MADGKILSFLTFGLAGLLFSPKNLPDKTQNIAVRNTVEPRKRTYGRCLVESVLAELKVQFPTGDGVLYAASMIASGEIDAIEEHRINDQVVRIDGTGQVTYPGVWNDNSRVALEYHLGTDSQAASPFLIAAFPGRWTAQHQLRGIAYTVGKFNGVPLEDFATVYQAGVPNYKAIIRGAKVWDPRDEDQDADLPATWTWTQNAALIILDYLKHDDGMRLSRDLVEADLDTWIDQANICDEEIDLIGGGTEARYRLSGEYRFTDPPKDVLRRMLDAVDGRLYLNEDSAIVLEVGRFVTPTEDETFTDSDIISYSGMRRGAPKTELTNEIRATYTSPGHDFLVQEAVPLRDETSIARDGLQTVTLELEWCPSHSQAKRIMKAQSFRLNPDWMGTVVTNARGLGLLNKRYMDLTISDLGIAGPFCILSQDIDFLTGQCTFGVVSFPSTAYDWAATEEGDSPEFEKPGDWGIVVPTGATSVVITADGPGGGGCENDGGDGGARSVKTMLIDPADWGAVILFTVGAKGLGDPLSVGATDGEDTTVTGTLTAGAIAMVAGGGNCNLNGNGPGVATGGDTNTDGSSSAGGDGGQAGSGASENEFPGGGGHEGVDGANGRVTFDWVF